MNIINLFHDTLDENVGPISGSFVTLFSQTWTSPGNTQLVVHASCAGESLFNDTPPDPLFAVNYFDGKLGIDFDKLLKAIRGYYNDRESTAQLSIWLDGQNFNSGNTLYGKYRRGADGVMNHATNIYTDAVLDITPGEHTLEIKVISIQAPQTFYINAGSDGSTQNGASFIAMEIA